MIYEKGINSSSSVGRQVRATPNHLCLFCFHDDCYFMYDSLQPIKICQFRLRSLLLACFPVEWCPPNTTKTCCSQWHRTGDRLLLYLTDTEEKLIYLKNSIVGPCLDKDNVLRRTTGPNRTRNCHGTAKNTVLPQRCTESPPINQNLALAAPPLNPTPPTSSFPSTPSHTSTSSPHSPAPPSPARPPVRDTTPSSPPSPQSASPYPRPPAHTAPCSRHSRIAPASAPAPAAASGSDRAGMCPSWP